MSDRTPLQLIIHDCANDEVAPILELIEEYGLHLEYITDVRDDQLALNQTYMDPEVRCRSAKKLSRQLQDLTPAASWTLWEDPGYEQLGELYQFTPQLGLFTQNCDAAGSPLFTADEVTRIAAIPESTNPITGHEPRSRALGQTHQQAIDQLTADRSNAVLDRQRFSHSLELIVEAEIDTQSLEKVEQLVAAIGDSDALPDGIAVKSYSEPKKEV